MRREDGEMDKALLRNIPKVDELLAPVRALCPDASTAAVTAAVRRTLDALRESVLSGEAPEIPEISALCALAAEAVRRAGYLPKGRYTVREWERNGEFSTFDPSMNKCYCFTNK